MLRFDIFKSFGISINISVGVRSSRISSIYIQHSAALCWYVLFWCFIRYSIFLFFCSYSTFELQVMLLSLIILFYHRKGSLKNYYFENILISWEMHLPKIKKKNMIKSLMHQFKKNKHCRINKQLNMIKQWCSIINSLVFSV